MSSKSHITICILILAGLPLSVQAGGFLIYEHNATATGMAGARSALDDDPSALYFNPAAITELEGLQFQLGSTGILPMVSYEAAGPSGRTYTTCTPEGVVGEALVNDGENDVDAKLKGFTPIHLYASYNLPAQGISLGFSLTNPFGLGSYWPGDWDGRFIGTETEIQTFFSNPVIAVDIAKLAGFKEHFKLSLAAGYTFVYGTAHLAKHIDLRAAELLSRGAIQNPSGDMVMDGSATGHGWNLALYAELPDLLSLGFSLRGGFADNASIRMPFSGAATFRFNEAGEAARDLLAGMLVFPDESDAKVTMNLPLHFNTGIAYRGIENLTLAFDLYMAFFASYDELGLNFLCTAEGTCPGLADAAEPVEKNWHTSWQVSLGAEYVLFDVLPLRLGYGTVGSPVPAETYDPALPDGQRHMVSFGAGYRGSWWKVDVGYMLALWQDTKDNLVGVGDDLNPEGAANGTYRTQTHILSLSFSAKI